MAQAFKPRSMDTQLRTASLRSRTAIALRHLFCGGDGIRATLTLAGGGIMPELVELAATIMAA